MLLTSVCTFSRSFRHSHVSHHVLMLIQSLSPSFLSLALNNPVFPSYVNIAMKKIENDSEGSLEVESCRQKHFSIMKGF